MKKIIFAVVVLLSASRLFAQNSPNIKHYQAPVAYTTIGDSTTPRGGAAFIDYDTYFKTITITYKDATGKQHRLALTYNSGNDIWTMLDSHENTYWVTPGDINTGHLDVQLVENGGVVSVLKIEGITARAKATY